MKPTCDLECGTCRYQLDPTHCADVVSGVLPQHESGADEALARCRTAAQILIAEIGASGPESIEETARRAVEVIQLERGQKRSDLIQDLAAVTVALRDLIDVCERARHIPIPVVAAIEAARAVLGGRS